VRFLNAINAIMETILFRQQKESMQELLEALEVEKKIIYSMYSKV